MAGLINILEAYNKMYQEDCDCEPKEKNGKKDKEKEDGKDMKKEDFDFLDEETAYIIDEASDYFIEEGLNEDGVQHVIEQLGVERFNLFLVSISENYVLSEARRSGRIEPVTKTGKDIGSLKGGAKASAIRSKQKEKAARDKTEDRPSGMTAALKSQSVVAKKVTADKGKRAVEKAKTTQSDKKPLKDRIAKGILGAVKAYQSGVERHKAATQTATKAVKGAAKGASEFGKGVASGVKTVGKAAQATNKLLRNSYEFPVKKDNSYLETDMNKRKKNNEKAVEDMKKSKAHADMTKAARKHFEETTFEEKMKGEDPCWKGYEMIGKKKKGGKEVPNCVPKESYSLSEKTLEPEEKQEKERLVKGMKKSASDFKKQYGEKGENVMYATATKMAKIREEAESTKTEPKKKDKLNRLMDQIRNKK